MDDYQHHHPYGSCRIYSNLTQSVNRSEADANRLLYPQDSDFVLNKEWRNEHYEDNLRLQYAMLSHDSNVLTKNGVLKVLYNFPLQKRSLFWRASYAQLLRARAHAKSN